MSCVTNQSIFSWRNFPALSTSCIFAELWCSLRFKIEQNTTPVMRLMRMMYSWYQTRLVLLTCHQFQRDTLSVSTQYQILLHYRAERGEKGSIPCETEVPSNKKEPVHEITRYSLTVTRRSVHVQQFHAPACRWSTFPQRPDKRKRESMSRRVDKHHH